MVQGWVPDNLPQAAKSRSLTHAQATRCLSLCALCPSLYPLPLLVPGQRVLSSLVLCCLSHTAVSLTSLLLIVLIVLIVGSRSRCD